MTAVPAPDDAAPRSRVHRRKDPTTRRDQPDPDDPRFPALAAPDAATVTDMDDSLVGCRACPRLVAWREHVASIKRRAFRECDYWANPVAGFGPADARLAIVGLAPAAHGGNRTGRIFTGDPAGDALYASLHAVGLASQPTATHPADGLRLYGVRLTTPGHSSPP